MTRIDPIAVAQELASAYVHRAAIPPPSTRFRDFDLSAAYAVEAELARIRRAAGHTIVGRKVGYANKAVWRILRLDTLVWAHMYDDTLRYADGNAASLSLARMYSPKIEPEIVFKLKHPLLSGDLDARTALEAVEWLALGYEIIDCVFPDWKFQPADFVAAYGLHAALVVGEPRRVDAAGVATLVDQLPRFKITLMQDGTIVDEGSGRNSLRSPALCLAELAAAVLRAPEQDPLGSGEVVSSGTLTDSHPIEAGQTWTAHLEGLDLPDLTLRTM
jgi:2-oxo-3-hexenedioate decarboxylase